MASNSNETRETMIRCVVLYYEEGKSNKDYREKEQIRITVPTDIKYVKDLENIVR